MVKTETVRDTVPRNKSYILRLWETRAQTPGEPPSWRFILEDPQDRARYGFANIETLIAFLNDKTQSRSPEQEMNQDIPNCNPAHVKKR